MFRFAKNVLSSAWRKVKGFFTTCVKHTEAITILTFSAIGMNALMGELPFYAALPFWIEGPLVIPVLSVLAVSLLVKSAEWRGSKRMLTA